MRKIRRHSNSIGQEEAAVPKARGKKVLGVVNEGKAYESLQVRRPLVKEKAADRSYQQIQESRKEHKEKEKRHSVYENRPNKENLE